nr:ATP synthase F0 subunit 6 [Semimytilus algosus]
MLMDVFSVFDDNNFNMKATSWLVWGVSLSFFLILCNSLVWSKVSGLKLLFLKINEFSLSMVCDVAGVKITGFSMVISKMFFLLLWCNLNSCVPYFFPISCHLPLGVVMSLVVWLSLVISGVLNSWEQMVAMLVPSGCPMGLSFVLVVIELLSFVVRPWTLVMRLVFNLVTGHILFGLLSETLVESVLSSSVFISALFSFAMVFYFLFELVVCCLQSYIFCILLCMYSNDHSSW